MARQPKVHYISRQHDALCGAQGKLTRTNKRERVTCQQCIRSLRVRARA